MCAYIHVCVRVSLNSKQRHVWPKPTKQFLSAVNQSLAEAFDHWVLEGRVSVPDATLEVRTQRGLKAKVSFLFVQNFVKALAKVVWSFCYDLGSLLSLSMLQSGIGFDTQTFHHHARYKIVYCNQAYWIGLAGLGIFCVLYMLGDSRPKLGRSFAWTLP